MRTKNFLVRFLNNEVVEELRQCAVSHSEQRITLDVDSSCYRKHFGLFDNTQDRSTKTEAYFNADERSLLEALDSPSEGVGDVVAKALDKMGVHKALAFYTKVTGLTCSCNERRKRLNKWFPFKRS